MNEVLKRRLKQIRHRMWVVLIVAVLGTAIVALSSLPAHPTYTGKSTLVVASPGRATDQDAFMAVGYATLFNDPATRDRLQVMKTIPKNVTLEARTAAASPILTIEATADDPGVAQDAAQKIAGAFRDDINSLQQKGNEQRIADLQRQLYALRTEADPLGANIPLYGPLQERITAMTFDSTNQLQDLQLRAGVVERTPDVRTNLVLGTVGGLLLGILAALGLAALSTRLTTSADLRDKTGVEPLVEIPVGGSVERDRVREDRLRALINIVALDEDLQKSPVLALTDSSGVDGARHLAEELATLSARQGYRTVLVYAANDASQANRAGFNEALTDSSTVHSLLQDSELEWLKILPYGGVSTDGYLRLTRERVVSILDELRTGADTIIIAAPSTAEITDAQLVCSSADVTLLVVSTRLSRAGDVTAAAEALTKAHASLLGAVLIDEARQLGSPSSAQSKP